MDLLSFKECQLIVENTLKLSETDVQITRYEMKRASSELVGFMGEYHTLEITITAKERTRTICYFVKTVPYSNAEHRNECERKRFFDKETVIYAEILPHIQKYASQKLFPTCYYTRKDLIVLEDLSQEYQHSGKEQIYTMDYYRVVLKLLAELHAASIIWEQRENVRIGEKFKDVLFELQLTTKNEWYTAGIKGVIYLAKQLEKYRNPKAKKFIETQLYDVLCRAERLADPSLRLTNVLCHRDTWDRNILYKYDSMGRPTECAIVDFQLMRYSPPALDVLFMLHITATPEYRHQIEAECLDYYFEELQKCLKSAQVSSSSITRAAFEEDCRHARLAALILWAIAEPLTKAPNNIVSKMRAEEPQTFDSYMNKDRTDYLIRLMDVVEGFQEKVMTPVGELLDYLLENAELFV